MFRQRKNLSVWTSEKLVLVEFSELPTSGLRKAGA